MKKKYVYRTDKELEGLRWVAKTIDFGVSLTATVALNELTTAYVMLRERSNICRHKVRQMANDARKQAELFRGRMFSVMRDRGFFDTYSDHAIDLSEQDVTLLRLSVKQTLDNHKYKDAELISYLETARTILNMAVAQFKSVMGTAKADYGTDYSAAFCEFNPTPVFRAWERLCAVLYVSKGDIDLNTPDTIAFFEQMAGKFAEGDYVEECLKTAYRENPGFSNEIIVKDN